MQELLPSGPLSGQPAGFLNLVIPCYSETDGDTISLVIPAFMQWWGEPTDQQVFGTIADAAPTGPIFATIDGSPDAKPVYSGTAVATTGAIQTGDYYQLAYDSALAPDGGYHLLNWSRLAASETLSLTTVGTSGPATLIAGVLNIPIYAGDPQIVIVTDSDPVIVLADDDIIVLNKDVAGDTSIILPEVALRNGRPLQIVDYKGNAQTITVTPNGAEEIMSLATMTLISNGAGAGLAAAVSITPNTELEGWFL
jgi:hypothetical protein